MKRLIFNPWLFITFVLVAPVTIFTAIKWFSGSFNNLPILVESKLIYTSNLVNQHNNYSTAFNSKEQIKVVNFFFTSCPIVCPRMTDNLKIIHSFYSNDPNIAFVSFTVDPERDDTTRLKQYIVNKAIDDHNWQFLTGDKQSIYKLARNNFRIVAAEAGGELTDFIHSDKIILLDTKNRIRGYYSGTDKPQIKQLIIDIKKLKNESSNFTTQ